MAGMDLEKVISDLNRRFSQDLPEFYNRRIIFWYDEDREFEDKIEEIELDSAKIVALTGTNTFSMKKLLSFDDTESNFLVYCPLTYDRLDDDWLLNLKLYSEEFRSDLNSIWIDEMGLPSTAVIRQQVKHYRKFFNAKDRRAKITELGYDISSAQAMHIAVMSVICGTNDMRTNSIIRAILEAGLDIYSNEVYQELKSYNADNVFWYMVSKLTGYKEIDNPDLGRFAAHIIMTALTRSIRPEHFLGLKDYIAEPYQVYCYDLVIEWLHDRDNSSYYRISRNVEHELKLSERIEKLDIEDMISAECLPCINEIVLIKLMDSIKDNLITAEGIRSIIAKRKSLVWYDYFEPYYEAITQYANILEFYQNNISGFHTMDPAKLWKEYTEEYYRMDQYYRYFHVSFNKCLNMANLMLDDYIKHVADCVEGIYKNWYLNNLTECWNTASEDDLKEYGCIKSMLVPLQSNFYGSIVTNQDKRTFVIIYDALRYETAASLYEQLAREMQCDVKLKSCQAIFPTSTKFGMAALLPHRTLEAFVKSDGKIGITADGQSTESTNRDVVLKNKNPKSVALQYKNIIGMKRAERSELVKGMDVVYIYHDKIDEASHTSDSAVFPACEDAIGEIKNLIRIICNDFGGTNIFVTSDHGFLYTYSPLTEDSKMSSTADDSDVVEVDKRYMIADKGTVPQFMLPVNFLDGNTDFDAFAPRGIVRIKKHGNSSNFVHGGTSLQEMVVPVIDFSFLRNSNKAYQNNREKYDTKPVTVSLLSSTRKVSNMIFTLDFYQKEAVSYNREAASFEVYMADIAGRPVSDIQTIVADKTSDNNQERTFHCTFNLKPVTFEKTATYYLVIEDKSGNEIPVKEEFQIDIAFAVDDFNFFS